MLKPNLVLALIWLFVPFGLGQGDTLGLRNGYTKLQTANFDIQLVHDAQVLASLRPLGQTFDFLPSDYLSQRAGNGQYHWGDITFRYRSAGSTAWINGDSAASRHAVSAVPSNESLAASNLKPTLPSGIALNVTREWLDVEGDLGLTFTILNSGTTALEIGSLGFPAEFNSIFTNRTAEEAQAKCSLSDPYIGMHGGFIRVSRLNGENPALVVTPLGDTPLEAYRNLDEPYYDATAYESQTFEGFYEWQMLTKAWADKEWNNTDPWNQPSSRILQPGKSLKAGLRFSIAKDGIRAIEDTVQSTGTPYARCVPGYIIPQDMPAQLLVRPGPGAEVAGFSAEPAGSLKTSEGFNGVYKITPSASSFGRARLTITYSDNKIQTVHYFITKPAPDTIKGLGQFLTTKQYFTNTSDPFGRAPSVMTYDYDVKAIVTQDDRVWIAGLSDEAGAGSFLAAAMKQAAQPDAEEIAKLEAFVSKVMWGHIQTSNYAVRKSIFYYDPAALPNYTYSPSIDWTGWQSWNKQAAYSTDRAYDYVHVAASYWAMYRAARAYPQLFKEHDWAWYLNQSYSTVMACMATDSSGNPTVGYSRVGLMGETVFGELLKDLGREGLAEEAESLEEKMRVRAALWDTEPVPFGSEMAWDSTGQEGVYYWSKYFGYNDTALKALGTVLGFQPTVPHWGWNGNARRYWDNIYGGKLRRIERQIHHYGSGLNSLVALSAFRSNPDDLYLLRIGYGGMNGPLSNINAEGFAAASFHSWPETLAWDGYSGDYGPNFLGLTLGSASYLVEDPDIGMVAYGGVVTSATADSVTLEPRDAIRKKVFIGPVAVLIEVDAGRIFEVTYQPKDEIVLVKLGQDIVSPQEESALLWIETEGQDLDFTITPYSARDTRGGWQIALNADPVVIKINWTRVAGFH